MQYGQRKLQRSMTEMRRSWIGRRSVSTRPARADGRRAERRFRACVHRAHQRIEARHESFRKRVGARRQFDESVGAGERGEIARAVGGAGSAEVRPQSSLLELHRQVERERRLDLDGRGERDARRFGRRLAHGGAQRGQHVARQAHQRRHRDCRAARTPRVRPATRQTTSVCRAAARRDGTPGSRRASPAPCGTRSSLPIDTPPERISTSCVRRWKPRRSVSSRFVVAHVIVGDAREAVLAQRRGDAVGIRAAHLVRLDQLARLDQLVAGGDHHDHGLGAHAHARHAGAGGDRHFGRRQPRAGGQQQRALPAIRAAPVHVLPRLHAACGRSPRTRRCVAPARPAPPRRSRAATSRPS